MKKLLTIMLAVLLTVTAATTITAISLTSADTVENVCYIERNGEEYPTVASAVKAAADGDVIIMTADSVESGMIGLGTKSLTIDGKCKYTIDSSSLTEDSTSYQFYNAVGNGSQCVTVKDVTLINTSGFWLRPSTVNLENCTVITNGGNAVFLTQKAGCGSYSINLKNTTWVTAKNGGTYPFATIGEGGVDCKGTFNIENSSIDFYGNSDGCTMFYCNTTGEFAVNVLSGSKLKLLGEYGQSFFYFKTTPNCDILLDKGVEIIFESTYSSPAFTTSDKATVTDNGAIWKNASEASANISLPILSRASKTQIGWASGDKLYCADGQAVAVEGGAEFSPVFFSSEDFALVSGASLRYADNAYGLRFSTNVSDELYEGLGNHAVYKTYVVPLVDNEVTPIGDTAREKLEFVHEVAHEDFAEGFTTLHASTVMSPAGISSNAVFSMSLSAYSEMTVSYDNGTEATFATDFDKTANTRSLSQVAHELEATGQGNALTEYILSVCPYT